jgi:predicted lipoprotein with Yx(FWY)xxD motif
VRRILSLVVATALVASLTTALASASASRAKLQVRRTSVGTILVNSRGFTVYAFTLDRPSQNNCAHVSGCLPVWPPVTTSGKAIAGRGVSSRLIGTITLRKGVEQVTYAGPSTSTSPSSAAAGRQSTLPGTK